MNDTDRALVDRLLDDDLSPEETAGLLQRVEADHGAVAYLSRRALLHTGLQQALKQRAMQRTALLSAARLEGEADDKIIVMPQARFRRLIVGWAAAAGTAAAAFVALVVLLPRASADPAAVLRLALRAHGAVLDRCYRVEVLSESHRREATGGGLPLQPETLLWTRGDRFWNHIRVGDQSVAWGRDGRGGVWFTLSPDAGARLDRDEVPEALAQACDLRGLELESLLRSILADFNLRREPTASGAYLIHAELKEGRAQSRYHSAMLEVGEQDHVLRRVVLHRMHNGRPVAAVTFTLIATRLDDDASYTLEGHLSPGAEVYDRQSGRGRRGPLITEFLRLIRVRPAAETPADRES